MKFRRACYSACLLLAMAGVVVWLKTSNQAKEPPPPVTHRANSAAGSRPGPRSSDSSQSTAPVNPQAPTSLDSKSSTQPIELILEQIHDASVTYDARELSKIQPFLTHSDPVVRKAAMNGMIVLGDASAGVMLRDAAKSVQTPQEAVAMLEAADYVELPSATNVLKTKKRGNGDEPRENPQQVVKPGP